MTDFNGTTGNAVLSESAWLLPGFDAEVDQAGSKETQTLLCTPMVDSSGTKVGCVLAINKRKGQFTRQDEAWLKVIFVDALSVQWECLRFCSQSSKSSHLRNRVSKGQAIHSRACFADYERTDCADIEQPCDT